MRCKLTRPSGEFSLIYQQIAPLAGQSASVTLGIGDDAAILCPPANQRLAVAMDTMVENRHFFPDCDPADLGWKCLAVNLSDLAAMGASPLWALLSLSLPERLANAAWLSAFMQGWKSLAEPNGVALVGGDTTRAKELSVSVTVVGALPATFALTRSGAKEGDDIWVSGQIGDAGLAVAQLYQSQQPSEYAAFRLHRPQPRLALGAGLLTIASAAMDVSDGVLADLTHLATASQLGAELWLDAMPFSDEVVCWMEQAGWQAPVISGDDYELLFTAPPHQRAAILSLAAQTGVACCRVGLMTAQSCGVTVKQNGSSLVIPEQRGYDHFQAADIMKKID